MELGDFKSLEGVKESHVFMTMLSPSLLENPGGDIRPVLELGAAMLLDKPIIVMECHGAKCPENLRKVAWRIIEFDPEDMDKAADEVKKVFEEIAAGRVQAEDALAHGKPRH